MNNFLEKLKPTYCNECNLDYADCEGCSDYCRADMVNAYAQGRADAIDVALAYCNGNNNENEDCCSCCLSIWTNGRFKGCFLEKIKE